MKTRFQEHIKAVDGNNSNEWQPRRTSNTKHALGNLTSTTHVTNIVKEGTQCGQVMQNYPWLRGLLSL
jgi:hypothetical protein